MLLFLMWGWHEKAKYKRFRWHHKTNSNRCKKYLLFFFFHFDPHIIVWSQIDCCLCLSTCALVFNWQIKWPKLKSSVSRALYFKSNTTNVNKSKQEIKQAAEGRQGHKFSVFSSGGDKYAKTILTSLPADEKKITLLHQSRMFFLDLLLAEHTGGPLGVHGERHRSRPGHRGQRPLLLPAALSLLLHRRGPRHRHSYQAAGLRDHLGLSADCQRHGRSARTSVAGINSAEPPRARTEPLCLCVCVSLSLSIY